MIEMETKQPHEYRGKQLKPGDRFLADNEHVKLLVLVGRAEIVPQSVEVKQMIESPRNRMLDSQPTSQNRYRHRPPKPKTKKSPNGKESRR